MQCPCSPHCSLHLLLLVTWEFIVIAAASEAVCGICGIEIHDNLPPLFIKIIHLGK